MSKFTLGGFADEAAIDLKKQMDVFDTLGLKYIEMRGVNGKPLVEHTVDEVKAIKAETDARGFTVFSIGSPIGKISIKDEFAPHLDLFKHTLDLAKVLDAKFIRMFSFFFKANENPDEYEDEVMNRWRQFADAAKGYDIVLAHENQNTYGDTPVRCLKLLKTIDRSYVKHCFDTGAFSRDTVVYPYAYDMLKDHIAYLHIKDAKNAGGGCVPAGTGDKQVKEVIAALHADGYEGMLSLEPHLAFTSPADFLAGKDNSVELFTTATNALKNILYEVTGLKY